MITTKTVYVTEGKEFDTLARAIDYRESLVNEFAVRALGVHAHHRANMCLTEYILANREELRRLLEFADDVAEE